MRAFYCGRTSRSLELIRQRLDWVRTVQPLTIAPALLGAHSLHVERLAAALAARRPIPERYDEQIATRLPNTSMPSP